MEIIVADISTLEMEATYDRIFSIEMFEVQNPFKSFYNIWSLFWHGSRWVLLFDTAHEELQGSSQEDIWVDETG